MLTQTMFALGRRYALSGRAEQELIMRDALGRINHWMRKEGDDKLCSSHISSREPGARKGMTSPKERRKSACRLVLDETSRSLHEESI